MTTLNYSVALQNRRHGFHPPFHLHHPKQIALRCRHLGCHPPSQLQQQSKHHHGCHPPFQQPRPKQVAVLSSAVPFRSSLERLAFPNPATSSEEPTPNSSSHGHAHAAVSVDCARANPCFAEIAPFIDCNDPNLSVASPFGGNDPNPSTVDMASTVLGNDPNPSFEDMASPADSNGSNPSVTSLVACTKLNTEKASGLHRAVHESFCNDLTNLGITDSRLTARLQSLKPLTNDQKVKTISNLIRITNVSPDQACKMLIRCRQLGNADEDKLTEGWEFLKEEVGLNQDSMINMVISYPQLLLHNVDKMRKIHNYLASVAGFSHGDLSSVYLKRPKIFSSDVEVVRHALDCLMAADVSSEDLVRIMMKAPSLFSPSSQTILKSRLDFFCRIDFTGESLAKTIIRRPKLLNFDLDSMAYAHRYLSSLMTCVDVKRLLHRFGEALLLDGITKMEPVINELLRLGVTKRNLGRILLHRPQVLGFTSTGFVPVLQFLIELGIEKNMLAKVISKTPQLLTMSREDKLIPALKYLQSIGLTDDGDIQKLVGRNAHIFCCNMENNINPKFEFFMSMGISRKEVVRMMVLFPSMFGQSILGSLQPKYDYLTNVMKRSPTEIIVFPQYFGYSLEKRIKPRHEKLAARGLHISLPAMLTCVEMDFCSRHLLQNPPSPPASDNRYVLKEPVEKQL